MLTPITTETIIPMGEHKTIFSAVRAVIRIGDQAGGPYLIIRGENDEPDKCDGENGHEFFLNTKHEIDEFAAICRRMLKQAEQAQGGE